MSRYVLSPRAQADLSDIWDYTAERWGVDQAEAYIRLIQHAIETVVDDPRKGRPCDEARLGYRKYPVGSHMIMYRDQGTAVDIVRILHSRMDFEQHV
jgi:toxin ParE1/3/4